MRVARLGPADLLARAGGFLLEREAEHNLILGLAHRLKTSPRPFGHDPYLALAEARGRVVAAALRTPPHNLVLSEVDVDAACELLALDVHAVFASLPGVLGPAAAVESFVRVWERLTGARARLAMAERIYQADAVIAPARPAGGMRPYVESDRALVLEWLEAFLAEALPENSPEDAESVLEGRLHEPDAGVVLWEAGEPVSVAAFGGPTPNGIRIGPVYTPPEHRGRGYASALVADATQLLLDGGRRFCFLFTNLSNSTSNSIYQRVGYRPVTDVNLWAFD